MQREVGGFFDLGVLAAERVIHTHEQSRGGLGDIVVVSGVVVFFLTTPVVPASLARGGLRSWNELSVQITAVEHLLAPLCIEVPRIIPTARSELRARNTPRGLDGGCKALGILRGFISIQHRHPNRRRPRRLNPDRVRAGDAFRFTQREVGAVTIDVAAMGRRVGVVEGDGFDCRGGDFGRCRGRSERRNDPAKREHNQNDEPSTARQTAEGWPGGLREANQRMTKEE